MNNSTLTEENLGIYYSSENEESIEEGYYDEIYYQEDSKNEEEEDEEDSSTTCLYRVLPKLYRPRKKEKISWWLIKPTPPQEKVQTSISSANCRIITVSDEKLIKQIKFTPLKKFMLDMLDTASLSMAYGNYVQHRPCSALAYVRERNLIIGATKQSREIFVYHAHNFKLLQRLPTKDFVTTIKHVKELDRVFIGEKGCLQSYNTNTFQIDFTYDFGNQVVGIIEFLRKDQVLVVGGCSSSLILFSKTLQQLKAINISSKGRSCYACTDIISVQKGVFLVGFICDSSTYAEHYYEVYNLQGKKQNGDLITCKGKASLIIKKSEKYLCFFNSSEALRIYKYIPYSQSFTYAFGSSLSGHGFLKIEDSDDFCVRDQEGLKYYRWTDDIIHPIEIQGLKDVEYLHFIKIDNALFGRTCDTQKKGRVMIWKY